MTAAVRLGLPGLPGRRDMSREGCADRRGRPETDLNKGDRRTWNKRQDSP